MSINVTSKPLTAVQSMFLYCCLVVVIVYPRCELFELCPGKILTQRFAQQTLDKERANNCHPFQLRILDNNQRGSWGIVVKQIYLLALSRYRLHSASCFPRNHAQRVYHKIMVKSRA